MAVECPISKRQILPWTDSFRPTCFLAKNTHIWLLHSSTSREVKMPFKQARHQYFFKGDPRWVFLAECIPKNSNSSLTLFKPIAYGLSHYYGSNTQFEDVNRSVKCPESNHNLPRDFRKCSFN